MAFTTSSVLKGWKAEHGLLPARGGDPALTRASAAAWIDKAGKLHQAPINSPRHQRVKVNGRWETALLLELAATNRIPHSDIFSQWTDTNVTVTFGQIDPAGGANASLLNATSGGGSRSIAVTLVGDGTKALGFILKKGSAANTYLRLRDESVPTDRHRINIAWDAAGTPTLSTVVGAGSLFPPVELGFGWWLIQFTATGAVAANTNRVHINPAAAGTGTVYAFRAQIEDGLFPTSLIRTSGAVASRSAELFNWNRAPSPQAHAGLLRLVHGVAGIEERYLTIGGTGNPRLILRTLNGTDPAIFFNDGAATRTASFALGLVKGDLLELGWAMDATSAGWVFGRKNGGAAVGNTWAASSMPATWGISEVALADGVAGLGASHYLSSFIAKLADMTNVPNGANYDAALNELSEATSLLRPNGELLAA